MSMSLPLDQLRIMSEEEVSNFSLDMIQEDSDTSYFLLVDLYYPKSKHRLHNSFPLAPYSKTITYDDLSFYSQTCLKNLTNKTNYKATKLVTSFEPRINYLCHALNLKFYVSQGMEIRTIHKIISFRQKKFLLPYIDLCSIERSRAQTILYANVFKNLANQIFGKLIELVENRMDMYCAMTKKQALKKVADPRYKSFKICSNKMSLIFMHRKKVVLNMAYHVGYTILELGKLELYKLYYGQLMPAFNNELALLTTDTDSVLGFTFAKNDEEIIQKLWHILDTSNFSKTSKFYSIRHIKVPGYLKSELPEKVIWKVIALRAKCYIVMWTSEIDGSEGSKVTLKGTKKREHKNATFQSFLECLLFIKNVTVTQTSLRAKSHVIHLISQKKLSYSSMDDKRYYTCPSHSLAFNHYLIEEHKKTGICFFCANKVIS